MFEVDGDMIFVRMSIARFSYSSSRFRHICSFHCFVKIEAKKYVLEMGVSNDSSS